jgi:hypothetical protein
LAAVPRFYIIMKKQFLLYLTFLFTFTPQILAIKIPRKINNIENISSKNYEAIIKLLNKEQSIFEKILEKLEDIEISDETLMFLLIAIYMLYINPPTLP